MPREKTKFVIYWDSCRAESSEGYWSNLVRRANEDELDYEKAIRFHGTESASMKYPEDYPEEFVKMAEEAGIRMASHGQNMANDFRRRNEQRMAAAPNPEDGLPNSPLIETGASKRQRYGDAFKV